MSFRKHHGITMATNSWIENLNCERLAADPSPLNAGRLWFNETEKLLKYSSLSDVGAVIVRTFTSDEEVQQLLTDHTTTMQAQIAAEHAAINADIAALGNAFNYVGTVDGGVDSANAFDLDTLAAEAKDVGDYHKVTTAGYLKWLDGTSQEQYVNTNDGIVRNNTGGWDVIDNTNAVSTGTASEIAVTGSVDTGFIIALDAAFTGRMSSAEANIVSNDTDIVTLNGITGLLASLTTTDKSNLVNAINEVQTEANANNAQIATNVSNISTNAAAIATETARATSAEGVNATAIADETVRATAAEGVNATAISDEVTRAGTAEGVIAGNLSTESIRAAAAEDANAAAIADLEAAAGGGADALQIAINAKVAVYTAASAQLSHVFNHGLSGETLTVEVWAKDGTKWYNDSALVEMDAATTTVTVPLQVPAVIKIIVEDKSPIA